MKHRWIIVCISVSMHLGLLFVRGFGCFSRLSNLSGTNNCGLSTGTKIAVIALDVVTMPLQLPLWLIVGIGVGINNLNHFIENRSWEAERNALYAQFVKDSVKMQDAISPKFQFKGLLLGKVYADESIPLSEEFLVKNIM